MTNPEMAGSQPEQKKKPAEKAEQKNAPKTRKEKLTELDRFDDECAKKQPEDLQDTAFDLHKESTALSFQIERNVEEKIGKKMTEVPYKDFLKAREEYMQTDEGRALDFDMYIADRKLAALANVWAEKTGANRVGVATTPWKYPNERTENWVFDLRRLGEFKEECASKTPEELTKEVEYWESRIEDSQDRVNTFDKYSSGYNYNKHFVYWANQYLNAAKDAM
jgi:hypothetical protein